MDDKSKIINDPKTDMNILSKNNQEEHDNAFIRRNEINKIDNSQQEKEKDLFYKLAKTIFEKKI